MSGQTWCKVGAVSLVGPVVGSVMLAGGPAAAAGGARDAGHGFGRMGPAHARTTSVAPSSGPDFEMPFVCGQRWTGTTRASHSPSVYAIDWNAPGDLGKPALASAPGVVVKAVSLKDSYGKYVVVDHGRGFSSLYAHLRNITTTVGTYLDQGELVGRVGGTGNATGPHLHFEERKDGAYFPPYQHRRTYVMGTERGSVNCGDRPVSGDWNGDGTTDVGVYRSTVTGGLWQLAGTSGTTGIRWGGADDTPLVGDWDGNGRSEVGVRRLKTTVFTMRAANGRTTAFSGVGSATDTTVTGDWNGDGKTDVGAYRASTHTFLLRSGSGSFSRVVWGSSGARAVSGDWSRRGHDEVGVFYPATATWKLRVRRAHGYATRTVVFGSAGDLPVTGDWNRDGVTDLGTWTPGTTTFHLRSPSGGRYVTRSVRFGHPR